MTLERKRLAEFMKTWKPKAYDADGNALFSAQELAPVLGCRPGEVVKVLARFGAVRKVRDSDTFKVQ